MVRSSRLLGIAMPHLTPPAPHVPLDDMTIGFIDSGIWPERKLQRRWYARQVST